MTRDIRAALRRMRRASLFTTVAIGTLALEIGANSPLDGIVAEAVAPARLRTALVAPFAVTGLAVAAIGLHGLVSSTYVVSAPHLLTAAVAASLAAVRVDPPVALRAE